MNTQQKINFKHSHIDKVIINAPNSSPESITTSTSFKSKQSEIDAFDLFCGRNDISRSEGIRDAMRWYMQIYPYKDMMVRQWKALVSWLTNLT